MPLLLRKVKFNRWVRSACTWLGAGQSPADVLSDFATRQNELSLWEVADDKANLNRIVAAIAVTMERLDPFEFILVDQQHVVSAGFQLEAIPGETPDAQANAWHVGATSLTSDHINTLARTFWLHGNDPSRILSDDLSELVSQSIHLSHLDLSNKKFHAKLRGRFTSPAT